MKLRLVRRRFICAGLFLVGSLFLSTIVVAQVRDRGVLQEEAERSFKYLTANIAPEGTAPGSVVAASSKQNPDYFYHWVRDASLVMDVVFERYRHPANAAAKETAFRLLDDFANFSRKNQTTQTPSGGPGEPKFYADGKAFTGPWGRPQNDGPALRGLVLAKLAQQWLDEDREDLVRRTLYDSKIPTTTVIKEDLDFVSHHWQETCFDLWEEIRGHHFYTRLAQRRALLEGARLADRMADPGAAGWYRLQAKQLDVELARHWDANRRLVVPTLDRDGGIDYKTSGIDSSVILAVLHAPGSDGFFDFTDDRILATFAAQREVFQRIYPINGNGMAGVAIGRYPEDRYDGLSTGREGNPWALTTLGFAEFLYRSADAFSHHGEIVITALNQPFFTYIDGAPSSEGRRLRGLPLKATVERMRRAGDAFVERARYHAKAGGHYSEQINRYNGTMQGAEDLTWSYASFVTAIRARGDAP